MVGEGRPRPYATERIVFRSWCAEDEPLARALWGDPRVTRFIDARARLDDEAVRARLDAEIACERQHGIQYWPVFLHDGTFAGACGLHPRDPAAGVLELGFHFLPEHWGRGLAGEAARAAIAHAFDRLRVGSLFAGHHPDNAASRRTLEKLGFTHTHDEPYAPTGRMHPGHRLASHEQLVISVDVHYAADAVSTACVGFHGWRSEGATHEWVDRSTAAPAPYRAGAFFERELPFILAALSRLPSPPATMIVDGYVTLAAGAPGLGARLHEALPTHPAVIGVAKKPFAGAASIAILRGRSRTPLHVSAIGLDAARAAELVRTMHGPHRLPTLLQRTDHLARGLTRPGA